MYKGWDNGAHLRRLGARRAAHHPLVYGLRQLRRVGKARRRELVVVAAGDAQLPAELLRPLPLPLHGRSRHLRPEAADADGAPVHSAGHQLDGHTLQGALPTPFQRPRDPLTSLPIALPTLL
eukprot:3162955-Pleurochrysis_carterae.AAC.1